MKKRRTLLISRRDVASLLTRDACLRLVEDAFRSYARKRAVLPSKLYLTLPEGDFRAMPAFLESPPACGLKWVNVHPGNSRRGLPTVMALIVLNDPRTGFPLAIMDGTLITQMRTGAAGAVSASYLARKESRTLGLIGCGVQAETQLSFLLRRFPLKRVLVWGPTASNRNQFLRRMRRVAPILQPTPSIEEAVRSSDIVTTVTPSRRPLIRADWVKPGTHLNAIGADAKGKQELDPALLKRARVVVDDREQSCHSGELNVPFSKGLISARDIDATLGEVIIGKKGGRRSSKEVTVFDSTGLAIQDLAVASWIYQKALAKKGRLRAFAFR